MGTLQVSKAARPSLGRIRQGWRNAAFRIWGTGVCGLGLVVVLSLAGPLAGVPAAWAQNEAVAKGGSATYPLLDVNISDGDRLARLYIGFEVQCMDAESAKLVVSPQTREAILLFLRSRTAAELAGSAGKRKLREELIAVMNKAIGSPRVVRLYFLHLVVR